jgi:hypothetical protein
MAGNSKEKLYFFFVSYDFAKASSHRSVPCSAAKALSPSPNRFGARGWRAGGCVRKIFWRPRNPRYSIFELRHSGFMVRYLPHGGSKTALHRFRIQTASVRKMHHGGAENAPRWLEKRTALV